MTWRAAWIPVVVVAALLGGCEPPVGDGATPGAATTTPATAATGVAPPTAVTSPPPTTPAPTATPAPATTPQDLPVVLRDVDAAAATDHATLRAALGDVDAVALGAAADDEQAAAAVAAVEDGPIVVADAVLDRVPGPDDAPPATWLDVDMALAMPAPSERVVLRTLAVTDATTVAPQELTAEVGGRAQSVDAQPASDRIVLRLDDVARGGQRGVVVRIRMRTRVPTDAELVPARSPASYGLLLDAGDTVALGHWLPVPVAVPGNDGDVPAWGDLGAFAPGGWFVSTSMPGGVLRTGAADWLLDPSSGSAVDRSPPPSATSMPSPSPPPTGSVRQVAIGLGLRDLGAVWLPDAPVGVVPARPAAAGDTPTTVVALPDVSTTPAVAATSRAQVAWLADLAGPLPWSELDVVRVPMDVAVGMEFPGIVFVDDEAWDPATPIGEFVLVHEWAHQWFHALVGNGSLSDPVVDEPLAQWLSWRWYLDRGGQAGADAAAAAFLSWVPGTAQDPPGSPARDFTNGTSYAVGLYRAAGSAWVDAAEEVGVEVVDEVVRTLVEAHRLGPAIDEAEVVATATAVDPRVGEILHEAFTTVPD